MIGRVNTIMKTFTHIISRGINYHCANNWIWCCFTKSFFGKGNGTLHCNCVIHIHFNFLCPRL